MARETKSQRREKRQKKDRDRQQMRRDGMKAQKAPDTHAVDRSISEAMSYLGALHAATGSHWAGAYVRISDVLQVAGNILAARYDKEKAARAVIERLKPRRAGTWTLAEKS